MKGGLNVTYIVVVKDSVISVLNFLLVVGPEPVSGLFGCDSVLDTLLAQFDIIVQLFLLLLVLL
jgi:hypothetical protein